MLDISLLGTGGMMPMPERFLSSMILRYNGRLILTDCGEGTQVSLKKLGWGFKSIDAIKAASVEELADTESMNYPAAQKIYDFFRMDLPEKAEVLKN